LSTPGVDGRRKFLRLDSTCGAEEGRQQHQAEDSACDPDGLAQSTTG
jgi:hypothetical protein